MTVPLAVRRGTQLLLVVGRGIRKNPHWSEGRKGKTDSGTGMRKAWNGMEMAAVKPVCSPDHPVA